MAESQFCLEWDSHNKNICSGLSSLQQNGEFVDMTLAADGHHVKVHQMVLALASPYIKDLITSASCPHPVIFLNNVSYKTLCSILEYIYSGQTLVGVNELNELIIAAKHLHIKGLEDVKSVGNALPAQEIEIPVTSPADYSDVQIKLQQPVSSTPTVHGVLKRKLETSRMLKTPSNVPLRKRSMPAIDKSGPESDRDMPSLTKTEGNDSDTNKDFGFDDPLDVDDDNCGDDGGGDGGGDNTVAVKETPKNIGTTPIQYTISNQGSLQLIMNRFMYFLYYQYRDKSRQWRCVDNRNKKCMASVFTKDNIVLRRVGAHTHPFHDKNILKKVRAEKVYSALHEAEAKRTKNPRMAPPLEDDDE